MHIIGQPGAVLVAAGAGAGTFIKIILLVISYVGLGSVLRKAGFSLGWLVVPIVPTAIVIYVYVQATSGDGLGDFAEAQTLGTIFLISLFLNWVLFLTFSFVKWPLERQAENTGPPRRPQPSLGGPAAMMAARAVADAPPPPPVGPPPDPGTPMPSDSPAAPPVAVATPAPPSSTFCPWCGKERPIDALSVHHCGTADRPVAYCARCGSAVTGGETECVACGASLEVVRKR